MIDAQTAAGVQLQKIGWASPNQTAEIERLQSAVESVGQTRSESPRAAAEDFFQLLGAGRALAALAVVEQNALSARDWSVAAPAARLYLFLGAPERARRLLESTSPSADETERQRLIADAYLAELRLDAAAAVYREVLARRSDLADVGDVTCRCRRCRWRAGGLPLGTQNLAERTGASGIAGLGAIVALGLYRFHTPDSSCPNISARESHAVARCELAAEFERQSSLVAPRNG